MSIEVLLPNDFYEVLAAYSSKYEVSVDVLCERWARLGRVIESKLIEDEIDQLLQGDVRISFINQLEPSK